LLYWYKSTNADAEDAAGAVLAYFMSKDPNFMRFEFLLVLSLLALLVQTYKC
jgi:uncharacterized membrane protein